MKKAGVALASLGVASIVAVLLAEPVQAAGPTSLAECYLQLAATKANADLAYLVRAMCDDLFAPKRRALFVIDPKTNACVEWWLDPHGRYESAELLCRLEPGAAEHTFTLACQDKTRAARVSLVELQETSDRSLVRVGAALGEDLGPIFATLRECVKRRAAP